MLGLEDTQEQYNTSSANGCEDKVEGWVDAEGDTCQAYATNAWCAEYGGNPDFFSANGVSAHEACCACGKPQPSFEQHLSASHTVYYC
jgi:hypothetical protein